MNEIPEELKRRVFATLRRFKQEQYRPLSSPEGVTPSEASVLLAIHMTKSNGIDPVQPRFIAQGLHLTPSALSQTLKSLDGKGLISRARLADDSRAVALDLTEQGAAVAKQSDALREQHLIELLAYIGREDIDHMLHTLEKILDFYKEMAEAGKMRRVEEGCSMGADPFLPDVEGTGESAPHIKDKHQAAGFEHSIQNLSVSEEGTA